jgi:regulatory protein
VPGRARPGRQSRTGARKRPGDRDAGETAVSGWLGDEDAALGWAPPDETMVPDGTDMADPGLWPHDEDAVRGFEPRRGSGRPHRRGGAAHSGTGEKEWFGGEEAARAACLKLLTSAPRTRAQLATALRRRRVPDEIAESVLARFAEVGLIDDAAFARAWVESRHHSRGLARKALAAELRQRGISDGEVRAAVDSLGPQDEVAAARQLVLKRMAATRGRPLPTRARQLLGMLARKGYSAGLAAQVVREALEQEEADDPDARMNLSLICEESAGSDWP